MKALNHKSMSALTIATLFFISTVALLSFVVTGDTRGSNNGINAVIAANNRM